MFAWKRSAIALVTTGAILLMFTTAASAISGGPMAVSGHEEDGKVVLSWLPPETSPATINQTGCDSMNMSMSYIYSNFTALYPNITVMLRGGGNDLGFARWIAGESDIDQASRAISVSETEMAMAEGMNVTDTKVAVESVAVIADPSSGVTELSFDQLRGLFNGSIANWKDVGGADLAVKVLVPPATGSPNLFFNKSVMGASTFASSAIAIDDGKELASAVANTTGAVGFVRAGFADQTEARCLAIKSTADGKAVLGNDTAAAYNGTYALSRYYRLYTNGTIQGAQAVWAAFILDPGYGQRVLADNGFLPLQDGDRENSTRNVDLTSTEVGYRIVRQSSDGSSVTIDVNSTMYVDSNVTAGSTYTYAVSAINDAGQESSASPISVTVNQTGGSQGTPLAASISSLGVLMLTVTAVVAVMVAVVLVRLRRE
ncbi:MAG: substrate-binding domain-containing protein [Methanomassiliicoccus sp.]|nr:substrate-binding domain-containing protein [Methanomassiliicoccus sp.]